MITWVFVPLGLILPDQPNRVVRTRTLCGVWEGRPVRGVPIPMEMPHYPLSNELAKPPYQNTFRQ
jgi:hypothetical protein